MGSRPKDFVPECLMSPSGLPTHSFPNESPPDPQHAHQVYKAKAYVCLFEVPQETLLYGVLKRCRVVSALVCLWHLLKQPIVYSFIYLCIAHNMFPFGTFPKPSRAVAHLSTKTSLHFMLCDYKWSRGLGCPTLRLSVCYLFMAFYLACCVSADGFVCLCV